MKLSGAGEDAQTALRDALSLSPLREHRSGRNRGWGSLHHLHQRLCVLATCDCVHVRMCECCACCVDIFPTVVTPDAIETNGGFETRWGPLLPVQGQGAADCSLMGLLLFNALRLSV